MSLTRALPRCGARVAYAAPVPEAGRLSDAVVAWTGYGEADSPQRNDDRVRQRFGAAEAERLLPMVRAVEAECWASKAHLARDDAIEAVVWAYTFNNKSTVPERNGAAARSFIREALAHQCE